METTNEELLQLEALQQAGAPQETIAMIREIFEEHPDAAAIAVSLLGNGWTMTPSGEKVICITLRSADGRCEVLGHGSTILDAFEDIQLKTKNFSTLLSISEEQ